MSILGTIKTSFAKPKKAAPKKAGEKKTALVAEAAGASGSKGAYLRALIVSPYVTEKSSMLQAHNNTYVFKVDHRATTNEIRKAVEQVFGVTVRRVNMANMPSKKIRVGLHEGRVPGFRKAMVTLKAGDKIDIGA